MSRQLFDGLTSEDALLRTEQLLAAVQGVIWEADPVTGQFAFVNSHAERLLDLPAAQWLLPGFWASHLHAADRDATIAARQEAIARRQDHELEYRMVGAGGRVTWLRDVASVTVEPSGDVRVRGLIVDVSAQKRAEAELRCLTHELHDAQRLARLVNFTHDLHTDALVWSPHVADLLGTPREHLPTLAAFLGHVHPDDRGQLVAAISAAVPRGDSDLRVTYRYLRADGATIFLAATVRISRDDQGAVRHAFGTLQDVTEQRSAEEGQAALVRFLESLDLVNRAIQGTARLDDLMPALFGAVLTVFDCDRVFLARRVSDDPPRWRLAGQQVRSGFAGFEPGHVFQAEVDAQFRAAAAAGTLMRYDTSDGYNAPPSVKDRLQVRSKIVAPIVLTGQPPFALGLHHCREAHAWTASEERLLLEIGRRLSDALAVVLAHDALQFSERRLAEAQRLTKLGYWEVDYLTGRFAVSEETLRIVDAPPGVTTVPIASGRAFWLERVHPDDQARATAAVQAVLSGGPSFDLEYRLVCRDGSVRFVHGVGHATRAADGTLLRWFGTLQDLTPLRSAERALSDSDARFRLIVDHATDAIFLHGPRGHVADANQQACASLGYALDELIGLPVTAFDPLVTDAELAQLAARLQREEVVQFESVHRRKDGSTFPVEVRTRSFHQDGTQLSVSMARDISGRRRAEADARQQYQLMQAIVEGTGDGIYVKDLEGHYLLVNGAYAAFRGAAANALVGTRDANAQGLRDGELAVLSTGEPWMFEQTVTVDGAARSFHCATFAYWSAAGEPLGLIGVWRDVTEVKHLEEALRQAQKMEAIGRLAGGVAHNFNNLLTVILGYAEAIGDELPAGDPHREGLAEITASAERAAALTRQLLSFSRKQALEPRLVHLPTALTDLHALLRPLVAEDIEMTVHAEAGLGAVLMDAAWFEQAMTNLVVNALDAMPRGGRLRVEAVDLVVTAAPSPVQQALVPPGRYVDVRVWDSGRGMDEATRERIFEPFFTTKPMGTGTGLGLATVYGFITQTGGHIDVTSTPGGGTLFRLLLPCAQAPAIPSLQPAIARAATSGQETILLVEDEAAVRGISRMTLEARGYTVLEAGDGADALDLARTFAGRIDLLLTDLVMPRLNGRELAAILVGERPDLRVLFMSGYPDQVVASATPAEPRGFLRKPFLPSTLALRVRDVLDRPPH